VPACLGAGPLRRGGDSVSSTRQRGFATELSSSAAAGAAPCCFEHRTSRVQRDYSSAAKTCAASCTTRGACARFDVRATAGTQTAQPGSHLVADSEVDVYDEDRTLSVTGDTFTDSFPALGVHIYQMAVDASASGGEGDGGSGASERSDIGGSGTEATGGASAINSDSEAAGATSGVDSARTGRTGGRSSFGGAGASAAAAGVAAHEPESTDSGCDCTVAATPSARTARHIFPWLALLAGLLSGRMRREKSGYWTRMAAKSTFRKPGGKWRPGPAEQKKPVALDQPTQRPERRLRLAASHPPRAPERREGY
jgi:MYXO-CTERM domain-containing protein